MSGGHCPSRTDRPTEAERLGGVLNLRRATPADAPRMTQIARAAYAPYVERMGGRRPAPMDADYEETTSRADAWVVETEGAVIGLLVLVGQSDGMLLDNVAVLPSHQGLGAGRALLTWAEDRARAEGYARIRLYTNEAMLESQALYRRIGYVETHRAHDQGFARVYFEKPLPG